MHTNLILQLYTPNTSVIGTPTFKTEAVCLVSNVQLDKCLLPCNEWQIQHYITPLWQ